jgi:hypothetical protein
MNKCVCENMMMMFEPSEQRTNAFTIYYSISNNNLIASVSENGCPGFNEIIRCHINYCPMCGKELFS